MTGRISLPVICLGILGFSILYVPMTVMIVFSQRWQTSVSMVWLFGKMVCQPAHNEQLLNAFGLSLFIAFWAQRLRLFRHDDCHCLCQIW